MPPINQPADIGAILADLQRRIRILESAPQLGSSAIDSGALRVSDPAGNVVVTAGLLTNGAYGLQVDSDPGGPGTMFLADSAGLALPFVIAPMRPTAAGVSVAATSLGSIFRTEIELLQWDSVRIRVPWQTGTATGTLRITVENLGFTTTSVALPANSSGTQDFRWIHGVPLNQGPVYFAVQASTSNAAAPVTIWQPDGGATFYRGDFMSPVATVAGV